MTVRWKDSPTEMSRRCVFMSIYGDTGTGKTTLALTAPGPIALIHDAEKLEGIVQPFARNKRIREIDFSLDLSGTKDIQDVAKVAMSMWVEFKEAWYDAFTWARTIVLDTDTAVWGLLRLAHFGGLKPVGGRMDVNYGPVNGEWFAMFSHFKHQNKCNVISIGQTKEEYVGTTGVGKRTGRTIRSGQNAMKRMSDVEVRTDLDFTVNTFTSRIEKGWMNPYAVGVELEGDMSTYGQIMGLITEKGEEEWM